MRATLVLSCCFFVVVVVIRFGKFCPDRIVQLYILTHICYANAWIAKRDELLIANNDQERNTETRARNYHSVVFLFFWFCSLLFLFGWPLFIVLVWVRVRACRPNAKLWQTYFCVRYISRNGAIFDSILCVTDENMHIRCGNRLTNSNSISLVT